jgi:osmotically-inducible protein OsmY
MRLQPLLLLGSLTLAPLLSGCPAAVVGTGATVASVAHDRRSAGAFVEDQEISTRVFSFIQKDPELKQYSSISTTSINRRALLTGAAASKEIANQIADFVKHQDGVREVINEIEIHPEYSAGIKGTLHDSYITSQAKLKLFNVKQPGFDPSRIKVVTYNGSIYLMGLVTETEGSAAAEAVRFVANVNRVVKHFEYITQPLDQ